ncbi:hypothetical protein DFA_10002 [Cavenderia fasciculata]|uniref:WW domain-containing protein n=1 Tax=Cavenderia fasciculata TaxID=261658 RepID=F4Q907_CACFS|nr:uncharacterized protein DFA_10002 [Cavenderia fasciculata]EGG15176.1 hypothetical protein DFA_10002 [Cavenderia fasciculata]|eukprot:XP_004351896.1 hypothetical protein DFA_10002 [Cavenderia fasciculata]
MDYDDSLLASPRLNLPPPPPMDFGKWDNNNNNNHSSPTMVAPPPPVFDIGSLPPPAMDFSSLPPPPLVDLALLPPPIDFAISSSLPPPLSSSTSTTPSTIELEKAAIKIQSCWRGHCERKQFKKLRLSIIIIQKLYKGWIARKAYKKLLEESRWMRDIPPPSSAKLNIVTRTKGITGRKRPTRGAKVATKEVIDMTPAPSNDTYDEDEPLEKQTQQPKLVNMGNNMLVPKFDPTAITLKSRAAAGGGSVAALKERPVSVSNPEMLFKLKKTGNLSSSSGDVEPVDSGAGSNSADSTPVFSPINLRKTPNQPPSSSGLGSAPNSLPSSPLVPLKRVQQQSANPMASSFDSAFLPPPPMGFNISSGSSSLSSSSNSSLPPPPSFEDLPPPISTAATLPPPPPSFGSFPPPPPILSPRDPVPIPSPSSLPPPPSLSNNNINNNINNLPPPPLATSSKPIPKTSRSMLNFPLPGGVSSTSNNNNNNEPIFGSPPPIPPVYKTPSNIPAPIKVNNNNNNNSNSNSNLPPPPTFSNLPPPPLQSSNNLPPPPTFSNLPPPPLQSSNNLPPPPLQSSNNNLPPPPKFTNPPPTVLPSIIPNLPPPPQFTTTTKQNIPPPLVTSISQPKMTLPPMMVKLPPLQSNNSINIQTPNVPVTTPTATQQQQQTTRQLKPGWREFSTPEGKKYYHNKDENKTTWDSNEATISPTISLPPPPMPANLPPPPPPLASEVAHTIPQDYWIEYTTADGKYYYHNKTNNTTVWSRPTGVEIHLPKQQQQQNNGNNSNNTTATTGKTTTATLPTSTSSTNIVTMNKDEKKRVGGVLSLFLKKRPTKQDLETKFLDHPADGATNLSVQSSEKGKKKGRKYKQNNNYG